MYTTLSNLILQSQASKPIAPKYPASYEQNLRKPLENWFGTKRNLFRKSRTKYFNSFVQKRNFVQKNVLDVMKSEPVESESVKFIDKASGDTQLLKSSGLIPVYKEKKEFGQVPDYIIKKAREKEEKARRIDEELKASLRNRDNQLSETDRAPHS
ncbi:unnamed protein product [Lepeophtheirus salmonis]|uniref:(salmon louse) hypothetical protein n=1 Tax=Lepeophtheirus salmonis TaxID=72036 RepID=A0A7R8CJH7_LEPSM|nr:unnamed protein product [Lepeophtheirus salmonis]CAF2841821.1 unnamed protein product [Lepeophtheirus salmonis]